MSNTMSLERPFFSTIKTKTIAAFAAVFAAVALPQLFHLVGAISGYGTVPGEIFLPMHLPILLVGLLAGPIAGFVAGFCGPIVSSALSGMPIVAVLPFMVIELAFYGFVAGLMAQTKIPVMGKLLIAQIAGRTVRAVAVLIAVYGINIETIAVASIWRTVGTGLAGLILQWSLLPLIVFWIENKNKKDQ